MTSQPTYKHDAHVRLYYDQPARKGSKFSGQRLAVYAAYQMSLNGFAHDEFGSVQAQGHYTRVCFDECPFIVCFHEDCQSFVTEVDCQHYEQIWAQYIEETEDTEEGLDEDDEIEPDLTGDLLALKTIKEELFKQSMELESLAESMGWPHTSELNESAAKIQEICDELEDRLKKEVAKL